MVTLDTHTSLICRRSLITEDLLAFYGMMFPRKVMAFNTKLHTYLDFMWDFATKPGDLSDKKHEKYLTEFMSFL